MYRCESSFAGPLSMLAPRAPSAFVCLRCELRRAGPRFAAFPLPTPRARFSASTRRGNDDAADELEALSRAPLSGLRITKEVQPLNRLRKQKGKVIRETSASLGGLKQLGSDADILVLKEVGDAVPEEPAAEPEAVEPVQVPDIMASLQQEGHSTPEEIREQINGLRPNTHIDPNEPHYITQTEFIKLVKLLMRGFTQFQLAAYYSLAKNIQKENVNMDVVKDLRAEKFTAKHSLDRTQWQPGISAIHKRLPGVDFKHPKAKSAWVSKRLLVDRILRNVWHLVLMEEIESPGELELMLKPWQVALLDAGGEDINCESTQFVSLILV